MKKPKNNIIIVPAIAVGFCVTLMAGCLGNGQQGGGASSGNPAADRRAEQRVDEETGEQRDLTLYQRLGGTETIVAIVDDMTKRVIDDPRVNFARRDVETSWIGTEYDAWEPTPGNIAEFKRHMVDFLELASGGPADYDGRNMTDAHEGMRISNVEFDSFVGDLTASMERLDIGAAEQRDLLAIIETTRKQIVEVR